MGTTRPRFAAATALALAIAGPAAALAIPALPAGAAPPTIVVDEWNDELNVDGDCSLQEAVAVINTGVAVDACEVPIEPVIDLPAGSFHLDAPIVLTESAVIQGAGGISSSIHCDAVVGDCLDNAGVGTDLTVRRLLVEGGDSDLIHARNGAGALHVEDSVLYGGYSGVMSLGGPVVFTNSSSWDNDFAGVGSFLSPVTVTGGFIGGNDTAGVYSGGGVVSVSASTIWKNEGFGVQTGTGDATIAASTLAQNQQDAAWTQTGTITFSSATVVDNLHAFTLAAAGGEARAVNTVFADHAGDACTAPIDSLGFNVSDDDSCTFDQSTDRTGIETGLGPIDEFLALPAYPLAADSPLLDTGGSCHPTDELGTARPLDGDGDGVATCDVGAIEMPAVAGPPVDPADPSGPADPDVLPDANAATPVSARPTFTG